MTLGVNLSQNQLLGRSDVVGDVFVLLRKNWWNSSGKKWEACGKKQSLACTR